MQETGQDITVRVPPHSLEAEACVLGCMILDAASIDIIVQIVKPEFFYRPTHQMIYETIVALRQKSAPIDLVTTKDELLRAGRLKTIGNDGTEQSGIEYLSMLVEGVPNAANAEYYAKIVRDKGMLRELIVAGTNMVREAFESSDDAAAIVDEAEQTVFQIASDSIGEQAVDLKGLLQKTFETLQATDGSLITGVASGYHQLDELTSGFQKGEMLVLAARPSMGKTSCVLNIAEHMSVVERKPVAVFSLEMSKEQLAQRLLASHARFDLRQMRRGMISAEDWTKLQLAAGDLEEAPMYIDDSPMLTALQLRSKARRLKAQHDIQCVFIDYLQLMSYHGRADNRQEQITEISRGIKALARELEVPVVCAAQLNRGPADRDSHRPRMSDLRESGSIEQDADVVMLLHCEDYYHRGEPDYMNNNITELIVAKQRNGPTGIIKLTFLPNCTRFETLATPEGFA